MFYTVWRIPTMLTIILYGFMGAIPAFILRLNGKRYNYGKAFLIACACSLFSVIMQVSLTYMQLLPVSHSFLIARGSGIALIISWACLIKEIKRDKE